MSDEPNLLDEICDLEREVEELRADAARYRFIRDSLAQSNSLKMDGSQVYRLRSGWPMLRGNSFDEAVDGAMTQLAAEAGK